MKVSLIRFEIKFLGQFYTLPSYVHHYFRRARTYCNQITNSYQEQKESGLIIQPQ